MYRIVYFDPLYHATPRVVLRKTEAGARRFAARWTAPGSWTRITPPSTGCTDTSLHTQGEATMTYTIDGTTYDNAAEVIEAFGCGDYSYEEWCDVMNTPHADRITHNIEAFGLTEEDALLLDSIVEQYANGWE